VKREAGEMALEIKAEISSDGLIPVSSVRSRAAGRPGHREQDSCLGRSGQGSSVAWAVEYCNGNASSSSDSEDIYHRNEVARKAAMKYQYH